MRYNGVWNESQCPATGTSVNITNSAFYQLLTGVGEFLEYVKSNGTSSTIKTVVEEWYTNNIENSDLNIENALTDKIANVPYCADKTNPTSPTSGDYKSYTFYGAANRLFDINNMSPLSIAQPIFKCNDSVYKNTAPGDSWGGNELLEKPIGLITADEVAYAGGIVRNNYSIYYLKTSEDYWTMSPMHWETQSIPKIFVVICLDD